jgi:hypothetical protein
MVAPASLGAYDLTEKASAVIARGLALAGVAATSQGLG